MRILIFLLFLLPLSLIGQVESQFNGTLNVFSGSRIGSTNTFTISGIFNSTTTSYTSSQSDTGDIVQVQSGARFYWMHIYSIASNAGGVITCNVRDSSSTLTVFPTGKWSLFRPTPNLRLPLSPDGETNASKSATFNTLALRVDNLQTSVASATNCEQTFTKNSHGFRPWTPIYWTGATYARPTNDTIVPDYIVVDSLTANTFTVANCGTYATTLADGLYWYTSASPGYSLTQDTVKVPLFQVIDSTLFFQPFVGFNLMVAGGDVTSAVLADTAAAIRADFPSGSGITALTGDVTASGSGSVVATIAPGAVGSTELASTTVTAGSYTSANITVDADGRLTSAANGSVGSAGQKITFTASAPTDTATIWVDTILGRKHFWPAKRYNKGTWRQTEWYDFLSGYFGSEKPLTIIATGQSNMQSACSGSGSDLSTHPYLYRWDSGTSTWVTTAFSVTNPGLAFAKEFIAKRNAPVRIFHYAVGGTAIAQWQSGGSMYNTIIAYVNAADTVDVDAVIWHQGESDTGTEDAYYTAFYQVVNTFRGLSWFGQRKPWIVGGLSLRSASTKKQDNTLRQIGLDGDGYTAYVNAEGLSTSDNIHFRCAAIDSLGKRYYNVWNQTPYIVATNRDIINDYARQNTHFGQNKLIYSLSNGVGIPFLPGTGTDNFIWGPQAGQSLTSGTGNVIFAKEGGNTLTSGNDNYLFGRGAGASLTTGSNNFVAGVVSGGTMGAASNNFIFRSGVSGGSNNVNILGKTIGTATSSVFIGLNSGTAGIGSAGGTAIGDASGAGVSSGDFWLALGSNAATGTSSSATRMISIGMQSLFNATVRSNVIAIGDLALQNNSLSNVIGIGNSAAADRANQLSIGSSVTSMLMNGRLYATGSGSPEGVVTANVGSIYQRTDGSAGTTFYVKESGTGNTGWIPSVSQLKGSATLDFTSTAAGAVTDLTVTVTGASDGDVVSLSVPNASQTTTGSFSAWVSATNTVTVRYRIAALTGSEDPASGTFKVTVTK